MNETLKDRIIKALIELKHIKKEDIDSTIVLQKQKGLSLDKALIAQGLISEKDLMVLLIKELHIPSINLTKYKIDPSLQKIIPEKIARQYRIVPISRLGNTITIALSDPLNIFAIDDLKSVTGKDIDAIMSTDSEIMLAIDSYYGKKTMATVTEISKDISMEDFEIVSQKETSTEDINPDESNEAPIIRMVDLLIKEALKQRASDIHIEPMADSVRVRYRIDGALQEILHIPKENQNAVIVRIKIMSRLDITASRVPQDGRFKLRMASNEVDFRVSLLPTSYGQKAVLRVLDKKKLGIGLEGLGFSPHSIELLKEAVKKPFGMILITGPTGSGKSTTLYSILNQFNTVDKNIITIEDPVEYLIEGLTQIQSRSEIGLTFASGLRSILRQSPDVVMVGEIRDAETADIAIKASLTGQLVFSTLHTNDAAGALTRLVDMGVESFLVASSLVVVCAQRLCRKVCVHCKKPVEIPHRILEDLGVQIPAGTVFYRGEGCEHCRYTGYLGRIGITEVLNVDDSIREMIINGLSSDEIKEYARKHNHMVILREDIIKKFIEGETTLEEVFRITTSD